MGQFQEIKFIFVMGRKPEDLSLDFLSVLKSISTHRVSVLSRKETENLIRISEKNSGTLNWAPDAVKKIWGWTQGHPYLTQLLCKTIWDGIYDQDSEGIPTAEVGDVTTSIPQTMERGTHAFEWIWGGLPPAEKVIMSAMASDYDRSISAEQLETTLLESGIRVIIHELEDAPQKLSDWELIREAKAGYRFFVPLLGKWIAENKPLARVRDERDRINPRAERLYQLALEDYEDDNLEEARDFLNRSLSVNPNHLRAMVLLGQIYLEEGQPPKAIEILERAYKYDPRTSRNLFVQALLTEARGADDMEYQFEMYQRVQSIQPDNPDAKEGIKGYWEYLGDEAREKGDLEGALEAYQKGELQEKATKLIRKRKFDSLMGQAAQYKKNEEWQKLIDIYQALKTEFPEERDWEKEIKNARKQAQKQRLYSLMRQAARYEKDEEWQKLVETFQALKSEFPGEGDWEKEIKNARKGEELSRLYRQALDKLEGGKNKEAQKLLAEVIYRNPDYKEVAPYFLIASTGIDEAESIDRAELESLKGQMTILIKDKFHMLPLRIFNPIEGNAEYILIPGAKAKTVFGSTGKPAPNYPLYFAKYPVTNARYRLFIDYLAGKSASPGSPVREQFTERLLEYAGTIEGFREYLGKDREGWSKELCPYDKTQFNGDDQPAIVTWYEAAAYCQWLTALDEEDAVYRLPTDEEWEWAARGSTRTYPWGDEVPNEGRANYDKKVGHTTPVGAYPSGATPEGLMDMGGNLWEWMENLYTEDGEFRALRGGSWRSEAADLLCAARLNDRPYCYWNYYVGFRVVRCQS